MTLEKAKKIFGDIDFNNADEIKIRHRELVKKYHTDLNPNGEEKIKLINSSRDLLMKNIKNPINELFAEIYKRAENYVRKKDKIYEETHLKLELSKLDTKLNNILNEKESLNTKFGIVLDSFLTRNNIDRLLFSIILGLYVTAFIILPGAFGILNAMPGTILLSSVVTVLRRKELIILDKEYDVQILALQIKIDNIKKEIEELNLKYNSYE